MKKGIVKWVDICSFMRDKKAKYPLKKLSIFETAGWIEEREHYIIIYTEKEVSGTENKRTYDYTIVPKSPIIKILYD